MHLDAIAVDMSPRGECNKHSLKITSKRGFYEPNGYQVDEQCEEITFDVIGEEAEGEVFLSRAIGVETPPKYKTPTLLQERAL